MERVLRLKQIYDEKLPLMKIQRTVPDPTTHHPPPHPTTPNKYKFSYLNF